jgi:hypothetical protein
VTLRGGREEVRPPPHPAAFMVPPIARAALTPVKPPLSFSGQIVNLSRILKVGRVKVVSLDNPPCFR